MFSCNIIRVITNNGLQYIVGDFPATLQQARVQIISTSRCQAAFTKQRSIDGFIKQYPSINPKRMICTGFDETLTGTCKVRIHVLHIVKWK